MPSTDNKLKLVCVPVTHTIPTIVNKRCFKRRESRKNGLEQNEFVSKIKDKDYVSSSKRSLGRTASRQDETPIIEKINIHNLNIDKYKKISILNSILAKKLKIEGLLEDIPGKSIDTNQEVKKNSAEKHKASPNQRLNSNSSESNYRFVENNSKSVIKTKKRKSDYMMIYSISPKGGETSPSVKKPRVTIVFDLDEKEKKVHKERERTQSTSSDNNQIVTSTTNSPARGALTPYFEAMHTKRLVADTRSKYKWEAVSFSKFMKLAAKTPQHLPLSAPYKVSIADCKSALCRAFPLCRYGAACAFQHPRCKFAAACTHHACIYSHELPHYATTPTPSISSHVEPAANYKPITNGPLPRMCKYCSSCRNPMCPFLHPKACRYGAACLNKSVCKFYHADLPPK